MKHLRNHENTVFECKNHQEITSQHRLWKRLPRCLSAEKHKDFGIIYEIFDDADCTESPEGGGDHPTGQDQTFQK